MNVPIFKTKMEEGKVFNLSLLEDRKAYFEYKAGPEIKKLQEYLKGNTFIIYLLGKKGAGKGVYSKMFKEIIAPHKIEHFSMGDMVRSFDEVVRDPKAKKDLIDFLHKRYRGPVAVGEIIEAMENRSTKMLLPTELILALAEREISKLGRKAIFIDGFPRDFDQASYSLFFKTLIDYRNDPDVFVMIDVPMNIIDERIKSRVVCPVCSTSRNVKLLPTKDVGYDKDKNEFYLHCDNPECNGARMITKEGDELGIEPIRARLEKDGKLMEQMSKIHGINMIFLRNAIPKEVSDEYVDGYELTPEYQYTFDEKTQTVQIDEKPWEAKDDEGVSSYSLMPPPVVVSLIKQLVAVLGL